MVHQVTQELQIEIWLVTTTKQESVQTEHLMCILFQQIRHFFVAVFAEEKLVKNLQQFS